MLHMHTVSLLIHPIFFSKLMITKDEMITLDEIPLIMLEKTKSEGQKPPIGCLPPMTSSRLKIKQKTFFFKLII